MGSNFLYKGIEGYFTWPTLYKDMINKFSSGSCFVEIGVFQGRSLGFLIEESIKADKDIKIIGVDFFEGMSKGLLEKVNKNLESVKGKYTLIVNSSIEASKLFEDRSIDFVFIDAGHEYNDIKLDIINWLPKVKQGGVLAGHDYLYGNNNVKKVVDEMFGRKAGLRYKNENCWLINVA